MRFTYLPVVVISTLQAETELFLLSYTGHNTAGSQVLLDTATTPTTAAPAITTASNLIPAPTSTTPG